MHIRSIGRRRTTLNSFLKDASGATAIEYALIAGGKVLLQGRSGCRHHQRRRQRLDRAQMRDKFAEFPTSSKVKSRI